VVAIRAAAAGQSMVSPRVLPVYPADPTQPAA